MFGNILIAVGAFVPTIGGSLVRAGVVDWLYLSELLGAVLMFGGFLVATTERPAKHPRPYAMASQEVQRLPSSPLQPCRHLHFTVVAAGRSDKGYSGDDEGAPHPPPPGVCTLTTSPALAARVVLPANSCSSPSRISTLRPGRPGWPPARP